MCGPFETMKKLAVCAVLVLTCANAQAQDKAFSKLAKIKGVDFVHVDKSMIEQAAKTGEGIHIGEAVNFDDEEGMFLKELSDVKVFRTEEQKAREQMKKAATKLLKQKEWQPLIDATSEEGQVVKIYQAKNGEQIKNVVFATQDDETVLVVIDGTFDLGKMMGMGNNEEDGDSDDEDENEDDDDSDAIDMKDVLAAEAAGEALIVINGKEFPELHSAKEASEYMKANDLWCNHENWIVGDAVKEKYPNTDKKVVIEFSRTEKEEEK